MARDYDWKTGCDVEATLCVIGGRWKPVLVCHLLDGPKRFGALCRLTPNATERMITLQLRELEADGVGLAPRLCAGAAARRVCAHALRAHA